MKKMVARRVEMCILSGMKILYASNCPGSELV